MHAGWERRVTSSVARLRGGTGNSCESPSGSHGRESPYRILAPVLGVFKPSLSPAVTSVLSVLKRTTLTPLPRPALVPAPRQWPGLTQAGHCPGLSDQLRVSLRSLDWFVYF